MQRLILLTNDDGYQAQGIQELSRMLQPFGRVIIVAPDTARSGAAASITPTKPVVVKKINDNTYACSGTPVDCVKIALEKILPHRPDLVCSGINHGDNASCSIHYSGTMGAVFEACMKHVPAIGYSLKTKSKQCYFRPYEKVIVEWAEKVLAEGLPEDTCLNINFPEVPQLKGVSICRMARGMWHTEWNDAGKDSEGNNVYTLTGTFVNLEPNAEDTDYYALTHAKASVTPIKMDMTDYDVLKGLTSKHPDASMSI